jgi:glycosyltransferase involved in cell wall biosynthesis
VCSLYTRIICVNPEIRGVLISLGQDSERMEVLPAFLNVETPSVRLEAGLLAWIETHRPLFSTVLFFRPEYGFDLLIDCLARLKPLHPSFGCIVMGSGDRRTEAEKRVQDSGLAENILLLGDVDHDTCLALMSRSDVFLRPTLEDGDSISVREALSMGVPVVASRVGTRPSGAILFAAGDVEEMVAKVSEAVSASATGQAEIACPTNFWGRLMDIYGQVDGSKGALSLN